MAVVNAKIFFNFRLGSLKAIRLVFDPFYRHSEWKSAIFAGYGSQVCP